MKTTTLEVTMEGVPLGVTKDVNIDFILSPAEGHESLLSFYDGSLVGKKQELKKDILEFCDVK